VDCILGRGAIKSPGQRHVRTFVRKYKQRRLPMGGSPKKTEEKGLGGGMRLGERVLGKHKWPSGMGCHNTCKNKEV